MSTTSSPGQPQRLRAPGAQGRADPRHPRDPGGPNAERRPAATQPCQAGAPSSLDLSLSHVDSDISRLFKVLGSTVVTKPRLSRSGLASAAPSAGSSWSGGHNGGAARSMRLLIWASSPNTLEDAYHGRLAQSRPRPDMVYVRITQIIPTCARPTVPSVYQTAASAL